MFSLSPHLNLIKHIKNFFTRLNNDEFNRNWNKDNDKLFFFPKSKTSLAYVIYLKNEFKKKTKILLPFYYCNYVLNYPKKFNLEFIFYDIKFDDINCFENVKELIYENKPDLFININYFNINYSSEKIFNFCNQKNIWVINDNAHSIIPDSNIEKYCDFCFYSPHKFYSIPVGAILKIKNKFMKQNKCINFDEFHKKFIFSQTNKIQIFLNLLSIIYWYNKKLLKSFFSIKPSIKQFFEDPKLDKPGIDIFFPKILKKLMINYILNDKGIFLNRKITFYLWAKLLREKLDKNKYKIISDFDDIGLDNYQFIIEFENEDDANTNYIMLKRIGFPVSSWPDLPLKKIDFPNSLKLRNTRIFIPIHNQIDDLIKFYKKSRIADNLYQCNSSLKKNYYFEKINEKKKWQDIVSDKQYYLSQDWDYYDFYKKYFFVKIDRYLHLNNNIKKTIFQILTLNLFFLKIIYLNKGPIFLDSEISEEEKRNIILSIIFFLKKNKKTFVLIEPNITFNIDNIELFHELFCSKPNLTLLLNLRDKISNIKKNLKPKIRNILKNKKNIGYQKLHIYNYLNNSELTKFLSEYNNFSKKKKFNKMNLNKIIYLNKKKKLFFFYTFLDGSIVSKVVFVVHNSNVTYLINIPTSISLKKSLNYRILWKSIIFFKRRGFACFDFGGIDPFENKSVANFKKDFGAKNKIILGKKLIY